MGLPWLMYPLTAYSSRDPGECTLTPEQCAYKSVLFRNWYVADLVYGRGTVYFFLITLFFCITGFWALRYTPAAVRARASWHKTVAIFRFWAYRRYEIKLLQWQTPTIGVMLLLGAGFTFFTLMVLAPQPYYWPTTAAFGDSPPLATRSGWLALASIPFLITFATKANMIASLTGVSHEKLMVFHTWLAWAVLVLALLHTFPFIVYNKSQNMSAEMWNTMSYYWTGVIALVAQAYLTFMSIPKLRNMCYEFFKATHYFMAIVFMVFLLIHCDFTLTSVDYFIVAGCLYAASWSYSQMKTYFDHGIRRRATITAVSNRCLRVDIPVGPFTLWKPGQHMFLRFLSIGAHAFTAHPFTICSLPDSDKLIGEPQSVMTFLPAAKAGGRVTVPVLLEGAYGGVHGRPLTEYDRALVVACGSGAGFSLPFVMEWIASAARVVQMDGVKMAPKKMTVVIATRDISTVQWYEAALTEFLHAQMLEMPQGVVDVIVYLTSEAESARLDTKRSSGSDSGKAETPGSGMDLGVRVLTGRPDLSAIVREVTLESRASVGMAVCGPSSVLQAVRDEAAEAELRILKSGPGAKEVYLYSEVFGW
ncbi:hypothetical protein N0V93_010197 [Gnomoniopsis smithogilvyi]|uniref:FAD-binding FR-type domain-containing protein n=1 Tax=Gnomoniopsis smithogilvyi TaxID=1191159 RepID=A0A9W9CT13_9PEZI|nr:hypothetical protein N0V93_010197 [Gnomoniopsis smithogilvyi]